MNTFAHLALLGIVPLSLALFLFMPARRAVIASFLLGWMFLPQAGYDILGLPDYDRITAVTLGPLLGMLLFDLSSVLRIRFSPWDVVMVVWILVPLPAAVTSGLTLYDGFSECLEYFFYWGLPYFVGRVYFTDLASLRELAMGLFIGGLIYLPFCIWESRMSPQLHQQFYGFYAKNVFVGAYRLGGYRPAVFLADGLAVGMWMAATALCGFGLWWNGSLRRLKGVPVVWLVVPLILTSIWCKSVGAIFLMFLGMGLIVIVKSTHWKWVCWVLVASVPLYMVTRATGTWSGDGVLAIAEATFGEVRADSLRMRLDNEDSLVAKAMQRPVFGWGGHGGYRVYDESGRDVSITDGFWVIVLGETGLVGLTCVTLLLLAPMIMVLRAAKRCPLESPYLAGALVLGLMVAIWAIDCLLNAMMNPIYVLAIGGLTAINLRAGMVRVPHVPVRGEQRRKRVLRYAYHQSR